MPYRYVCEIVTNNLIKYITTDSTHSLTHKQTPLIHAYVSLCMCMLGCVCVSVCVYAHARVCVCVCVCARVRVCVGACECMSG